MGYTSAASGFTFGVIGQSASTSGRGVYGLATATSGTTYGVIGVAYSPSGYGVYSYGNMYVAGNFTATGTKSAVVRLANGEGMKLYAMEASENWFEDFGSARLEKGQATVAIDPAFAQAVNTGTEYHVFLTPKDNCRGLYVTNTGEASFEVRELNGGQSNIAFSYRIVAKRKGYEGQRLARVPKEAMTESLTQTESTEKVALAYPSASPKTR
jgi:hypothetical protein